MYEEYFGLKRPPFRITPDTSLFYDGGQRGDILGALVYAIHRGEGIIKVVGEVGSGKTMLCRMLQQELPDEVEIIYIANPSVSAQDILFVIANELKFNVSRNASKHEVVTMLQNYLLKRHAENRQVVLFIEEAQGMPLETLEEIRLLSNLETDQHKLLQIILFGQPELDQNLADNSIRQLRERITHDFNLRPLDAGQIHSYLNYRLREVGYTGPELVSKKLATKIANHSEGLLRRINILADKMLLSAFADGTHTLTEKHLRDAVNDSGFVRINRNAHAGYRWPVFAGVIALTLGLGSWWLVNSNDLGPLLASSDKPEPPESTRADVSGDKGGGLMAAKEGAETPDLSAFDVKGLSSPEQAISSEQQRKLQRILATAEEQRVVRDTREMLSTSKKIEQSVAIVGKVTPNQMVEASSSGDQSDRYTDWLEKKLMASKEWLKKADKQGVSIQVMMRSKSAGRELAEYLLTDWPLDLDKTYLYEVKMKDQQIYRVFYNEYPTISIGQMRMKQLPESVRLNSPYLHSIYRMQKALL